MDDHLQIRAYKTEDKAVLLEILKLNVPEYFAESEIKDFDEYLDNEIEHYFVVELDGRIIGAGGVNFGDHGKTGKISWDFIRPEFQGKGIGQKLLHHRIELLKSLENIESITVRTSQLAYKFYEKNGFKLKEVVQDYWSEGFDLYAMKYE